MTTALPAHTLMTTFLGDLLRRRDITVEHLADLLQPIPEATVRSWVAGWSSPSPDNLAPLAHALRVDPIELLAGWLIDNAVVAESVIWDAVLGPLCSEFPRSDAWDLIVPRKRPSMSVSDPHDDCEAAGGSEGIRARVKKVSVAARKREGMP